MSLMIGMLAALIMQGREAGALGNTAVESGSSDGATGRVTFSTLPGGDFDTAPQWIYAPDPALVGSVFPVRARERGADGTGAMECTLTTDGALTGCSVTTENPADIGFAGATLSLAPNLNIRPAMRDGRPVESRIRIQAVYQAPAASAASLIRGASAQGLARVVRNPVWLDAPDYGEFVAAYPAAARAEGVGGRASLYCIFADDGGFANECLVDNEYPAGYGFAAAAQSLAGQFVAQTEIDGASIVGDGVIIPFNFSASMLDDAQISAGAPIILSLPSDEQIGSAFPRAALEAEVGQGQAMVSCVLGSGGTPADCRAVRESPVGLGFAGAALRLAPNYRFSLWSDDGRPTVGGVINFPVRYDLEINERAGR